MQLIETTKIWMRCFKVFSFLVVYNEYDQNLSSNLEISELSKKNPYVYPYTLKWFLNPVIHTKNLLYFKIPLLFFNSAR